MHGEEEGCREFLVRKKKWDWVVWSKEMVMVMDGDCREGWWWYEMGCVL